MLAELGEELDEVPLVVTSCSTLAAEWPGKSTNTSAEPA